MKKLWQNSGLYVRSVIDHDGERLFASPSGRRVHGRRDGGAAADSRSPVPDRVEIDAGRFGGCAIKAVPQVVVRRMSQFRLNGSFSLLTLGS